MRFGLGGSVAGELPWKFVDLGHGTPTVIASPNGSSGKEEEEEADEQCPLIFSILNTFTLHQSLLLNT